MDRKGTAVAEIDLIRVHRQNFGFCQSLFEDQSHEDFRNLAAPRPVSAIQEKIPSQLHRQRTGPLQVSILNVGRHEGAACPDQVDAEMAKETLVFGRDEGIRQMWRSCSHSRRRRFSRVSSNRFVTSSAGNSTWLTSNPVSISWIPSITVWLKSMR